MTAISNPIAIFLAPLAAFVLTVPVHEFPLGHVERSLNVVVRSHQLDIDYAIGMSDETAKHLYLANDEMGVMGSDDFETAVTNSAVAEVVDGTSDEPTGVESRSENRPSEKLSSEERLSDEEVTNSSQLANETAVLKMLQERAPAAVLQRLVLICNGAEVPLEIIDASPSSRHHVSLLVRFRAKLPPGEVVDIKLADGNFLTSVTEGSVEGTEVATLDGEKLAGANLDFDTGPLVSNENSEKVKPSPPAENKDEQAGVDKNPEKDDFILTGNTKLALRAKGTAMLLQSNVAPVLARAKPIEISLMKLSAKQEACTIVARVGFSADLESKDK